MSSHSLDPEVVETLDSVDEQIDCVAKKIDELLKFGKLRKFEENAEPIDSAKLNGCLAYTLHTLSYCYQKVNGQNAKQTVEEMVCKLIRIPRNLIFFL